MKYSMQITVLCFIGFSVSSSSWKIEDRKGRNLSFSNILKNYLTKYPAFKEKPLENRQNRRKFPYKILKPSPLNHQKTAKSHFPKYSENKVERNRFEQNSHDKNARINFMQNTGAAFIQNFRESPNIPNIFVGSTNFPQKSHSNIPINMVRNSDLQSKSKPLVKIPKQMPEVTRNEINESAWISWSPKLSSPSPPPPQQRNGGFYHGQDDYKVVWLRRFCNIDIYYLVFFRILSQEICPCFRTFWPIRKNCGLSIISRQNSVKETF